MDVRVGINNLIVGSISILTQKCEHGLIISLQIAGVMDYIRLDLGLNEARDLAERLNAQLAEANREMKDKFGRFLKERKPALKFNRLDKKKIEKIREVRMVVYP